MHPTQYFGAALIAAALCALPPASLPGEALVPVQPPSYSVTDLGPIANVADDVALDVGDDGGVSLYVAVGTQVRAARWRDGKMLVLKPAPGYRNSVARATNGLGDLAGWSSTSANPVDSLATTRAFLYRQKKTTMLGTLGGRNSRAFDVSDGGEVVGVADVDAHISHAFLAHGAALQDLGVLPGGSFSAAYAINAAGEVVGVADTARFVRRAVAWRNGKIIDLGALPGGTSSCALAVNNHGDIAGYSETQDGVHAFLYTQGRMQDLGALKFDPSSASAINDRGEVVGASSVSAHGRRAFLWREGRMEDLNTRIASDSGWTLTSASSISNSEKIVCSGSRRGEPNHALLLTSVSSKTNP
ncbi:hypothetical protein CCAX7_007520 [Capsulimonas corticalis]|uniref:Uncharacterized protein n=1 Tax=Capsulimonas corticalis TaxID=2219043 RepID=A0A402D1Q2_9BACT|nr:hypothetical protein [Capsulimonas corticalis]BDI28701.1 hypothetical protein CCAX7_007520 [Capsulimonas corticalis]